MLRNLNKRKSARRGDDYDGALASILIAAKLCPFAHCQSTFAIIILGDYNL